MSNISIPLLGAVTSLSGNEILECVQPGNSTGQSKRVTVAQLSRVGGVIPGTYTNATVVVNSQGIISSITQGAPEQSIIGARFNGGGSPVATGTQIGDSYPFPLTITGFALTADQNTTCQIDIWVALLSAYPPTIANSICGSDLPSLTAAMVKQDTTLTGWSLLIPAFSTIWYSVNSNNDALQLSLTLAVTK